MKKLLVLSVIGMMTLCSFGTTAVVKGKNSVRATFIIKCNGKYAGTVTCESCTGTYAEGQTFGHAMCGF